MADNYFVLVGSEAEWGTDQFSDLFPQGYVQSSNLDTGLETAVARDGTGGYIGRASYAAKATMEVTVLLLVDAELPTLHDEVTITGSIEFTGKVLKANLLWQNTDFSKMRLSLEALDGVDTEKVPLAPETSNS